MGLKDREDRSPEFNALFAELREAYGRVAATIPTPQAVTDAAAHARFVEESGKASALIRRIRDIHNL